MVLPNLEGIKYIASENPCSKVIVDTYYDGPLSGLIYSSPLNAAFFFNIVAWDEGQDCRLYTLYNYSVDQFVEFEGKLVNSGEIPKYPIWILKTKNSDKWNKKFAQIPTKNKLNLAYLLIAEHLDKDIILIPKPPKIIFDMLSKRDNASIDSLEDWLKPLKTASSLDGV